MTPEEKKAEELKKKAREDAIKKAAKELRSELNLDKLVDSLKVNIRKGAYSMDVGNGQDLSNFNDLNRVLVKKSADATSVEKSFRNWNDDVILTAILHKKKDQSLREVIPSLSVFKSQLNTWKQRSDLAKAMDTATSGSGLEWIPTEFSSELIDKIMIELKVAAQFRRINMPTDTFKFSAVNTFAVAKKGAENTAPTTTKVGTRQVTLDAEKIIADIPFSYELEEDAAIALLPTLREQIVLGVARGIEDADINGDISSPHQDSDVVSGSDDVRTIWNGLRKKVLAAARVDLSTFTYENVIAMKTKLGKFGVNPGDLFWIAGPVAHGKLLSLKDSQNNTVTYGINVYGPERAANVKGLVNWLLGSPVLLSEFIREDLNTAGVYDASVMTKTILLLVNRRAFLHGDRRSLLVEQDKDISAQTRNIVASVRQAFTDSQDAANNPLVSVGFNVA